MCVHMQSTAKNVYNILLTEKNDVCALTKSSGDRESTAFAATASTFAILSARIADMEEAEDSGISGGEFGGMGFWVWFWGEGGF